MRTPAPRDRSPRSKMDRKSSRKVSEKEIKAEFYYVTVGAKGAGRRGVFANPRPPRQKPKKQDGSQE